ncbi:MAG: SpoIIE family protein phosphatase [Phycisphaerae bacterium]|nr:SpoIIE family protein phosphatase [Phycisphaerae bacterium]
MAKLTDYLTAETLGELQEAFTRVAAMPVQVCDATGRPLAADCSQRADESACIQAPIRVDGEDVGRVIACPPADGGDGVKQSSEQLLALMADVIGRLCDREGQLRTRVDQLATLYHVTAEFAGAGDLQGVLDRVTASVVEVLGAKSCAIRLLNEDRTELVVKSVANLSPEYLDKGPILLSESRIDQEVLTTGTPVCIADERTDPRVLYPAEARREGIVSALCVPLTYKDDTLGVIRVYTGTPHEFDWFEVSLLEAIAAQAAAAIVNARLHSEAVSGAQVRRQLRIAGEVQRRMIPAEPPQPPGFEIGAVYVPCYELGGDFYDFIDLPPDNVGVAVCDVVGKGVRASLLMASLRASLRAHASNVYSMSEVLGWVNRDLCDDTLTSDFATLFYGVLDSKTKRFTYANAGHLPPLLYRDGQFCHLSTGGGVLGIDPDAHWGYESFVLRSGDVVVAYTDGLVEAMNFQSESFGRVRAEVAAQAAIESGRSADGIVKHILWEMRRFAGLTARGDDLTIVAFRVL